jgi:peptide-methionine (R)-S-oxide reductase
MNKSIIKYTLISCILCLLAITACRSKQPMETSGTSNSLNNKEKMASFEISKTEEEWKQQLTPDQYSVIREKGTERPFTGKFENHWEPGVYNCAACGNELFLSNTKFDAGCGWPSFYEALDKAKVTEKMDYSHGMTRVEIMCAKCGGHLGHVFNDGPADKTGLRYCVNSLSLEFKKNDSITKK